MATSGYVDSWKVPSGTAKGAYYRWSWTATKVSRGKTKISWTLKGLGRSASPTRFINECYIDIYPNSSTTPTSIYSMAWNTDQSTSTGNNTSFFESESYSWRVDSSDNKSFVIQHDSSGNASFKVKIATSIYNGAGTGESVEKTITLDFNDPYYHVTYNANGGTGAPSKQDKAPGGSITLTNSVPTYVGYSFVGWGTSASDTTKDYDPGDIYSADADITLYAIWTGASYTVTYNSNGYTTTSMPSNQSKSHGDPLTLSSSTPTIADAVVSGFKVTFDANGGSCSVTELTSTRERQAVFSHWNTAADNSGTSYNKGASYTNDASVTLYLQATVTYNNLSITLPEATKTGYDFMGWATSIDAATGATGKYIPSDNMTLYAVWGSDGVVHINTGVEWKSYSVWINDGTTWKQYVPNINNGSSWKACGK